LKDEEYKIQCAVVEYLILQYPDVEFRTDMGGIRLPLGLAMKAKRANGGRRAWPDLFIAEPSAGYHGLFIEVKKDRLEVYGKRGNIRRSGHISEQNEKLKSLRSKKYAAEFGMGFEHCKKIIDHYLNGRKQ
jgi:hypothetical protein